MLGCDPLDAPSTQQLPLLWGRKHNPKMEFNLSSMGLGKSWAPEPDLDTQNWDWAWMGTKSTWGAQRENRRENEGEGGVRVWEWEPQSLVNYGSQPCEVVFSRGKGVQVAILIKNSFCKLFFCQSPEPWECLRAVPALPLLINSKSLFGGCWWS